MTSRDLLQHKLFYHSSTRKRRRRQPRRKGSVECNAQEHRFPCTAGQRSYIQLSGHLSPHLQRDLGETLPWHQQWWAPLYPGSCTRFQATDFWETPRSPQSQWHEFKGSQSSGTQNSTNYTVLRCLENLWPSQYTGQQRRAKATREDFNRCFTKIHQLYVWITCISIKTWPESF